MAPGAVSAKAGVEFDVANRVFFRLYQASNLMHKQGTRYVSRFAATTQQWAVLGALARPLVRDGGMAVKDLHHERGGRRVAQSAQRTDGLTADIDVRVLQRLAQARDFFGGADSAHAYKAPAGRSGVHLVDGRVVASISDGVQRHGFLPLAGPANGRSTATSTSRPTASS